MTHLVPKVRLSNGRMFPAIGLGTWQSEPGKVARAVKDAIDVGYRHIDCAYLYGNEAEIGAAVREKIAEGAASREDLFITSKLWNTFHDPGRVVHACQLSLRNLGLDYLDLYLIHWPTGFEAHGDGLGVRDADGSVRFSDVDYVDTWRGMESCVALGLARSIGVSNFNEQQLERLMERCSIKPVTNQVECHAYLNQKAMIAFCKSRDIVVTAYSPLGSPARPWAQRDDPQLLDDPRVAAIARRHGKTPAQVALRYLIQLGVVPIPKSTDKSRIQENVAVFDFELGGEEVALLDSFNCNGRLVKFPEILGHQHYPF